MTGSECEAHYERAMAQMRIVRRLARLNLEVLFAEQGRSWVELDDKGNVVKRS